MTHHEAEQRLLDAITDAQNAETKAIREALRQGVDAELVRRQAGMSRDRWEIWWGVDVKLSRDRADWEDGLRARHGDVFADWLING